MINTQVILDLIYKYLISSGLKFKVTTQVTFLYDNNCSNNQNYQLPLIVTSHINCNVARCLINVSISRHVPLSGHNDVSLFNDAESIQKPNITSLSQV